MSETLLEEGKVVVGSLTGPASLGADRALLQLTVRDGSDIAQLTRREVLDLFVVLGGWLGPRCSDRGKTCRSEGATNLAGKFKHFCSECGYDMS